MGKSDNQKILEEIKRIAEQGSPLQEAPVPTEPIPEAPSPPSRVVKDDKDDVEYDHDEYDDDSDDDDHHHYHDDDV